MGFELAGIIKGIGYKHGRWLSTVLMHRPLAIGMSGAADTPPFADQDTTFSFLSSTRAPDRVRGRA